MTIGQNFDWHQGLRFWDLFIQLYSLAFFDCIFVFKIQGWTELCWAELNIYFLFFKRVVFFNCKLGPFQLAQRKSVLGLLLHQCIWLVFLCVGFWCFPAHYPAKKTAESLRISQILYLWGWEKSVWGGEVLWKVWTMEKIVRNDSIYKSREIGHS